MHMRIAHTCRLYTIGSYVYVFPLNTLRPTQHIGFELFLRISMQLQSGSMQSQCVNGVYGIFVGADRMIFIKKYRRRFYIYVLYAIREKEPKQCDRAKRRSERAPPRRVNAVVCALVYFIHIVIIVVATRVDMDDILK